MQPVHRGRRCPPNRLDGPLGGRAVEVVPMTQPPVPRPLVLRRQAVDAGWSDDELAGMIRRREWTRLRRGAYIDGAPPESATARHALLVAGTVTALRRPAVVSHQSAAVLLGIPLWGARLDRVHVTRRPPAWNDRSRVLVAHVAQLRDDEITAVDGVALTNPVRTALDLARGLPFEPAVAILDAALATRIVSARELSGALASIAGTRGSRGAARAVAFADD